MELNQEQQAVVESQSKRILVVAGPGSGKTRVVVERARRQAADGADPGGMCFVTYTNAAADETRGRLAPLAVGFCGTLHSLMLRVVRWRHASLGLPERLSVVADDVREDLLETVLEEMGAKAKAKDVAKLLERPDLVRPAKGGGARMFTKEELAAVEYHARLRAAGLLDYFSILHYGETALRQAGVEAWWKFTHLYLDETQDCADTDWRIVNLMPCEWKMICGDPDQAIFGFRGGNVANVVGLYNAVDAGVPDVPGTTRWGECYRLQDNHRCGSAVCEAANRLVLHNAGRVRKETVPVNKGGVVETKEMRDAFKEVSFVCFQVGWEVNERGRKPEGVAVLCRTNRLASHFAEHMAAVGIAVAKRADPAKRPSDWKQVLALLTAAANPWSDLAVHAWMSLRYGKKQADEARRQAAKAMAGLHDFAGRPLGLVKADASLPASLTGAGVSLETVGLVSEAVAALEKAGGWTLADLVLRLNRAEAAADQPGVFVGTAHSAKGREFDVVFVCGVEEGMFPTTREGSDVEEERRLLYVACTRARERLVLTWCASRPPSWGRGQPAPRVRSRFLAEMAAGE
jgi:DNA helicase-2/ATP-dependent DNA helicase PcrA